MPVSLGLPTTLRKRGCDLGIVIATAAIATAAAAATGRVLDDLSKV